MASLNSQNGIGYDVVRTAIDGVWDQSYNVDTHPEHASAETSKIFRQETTDKSAEIVDSVKGVGEWGQRAEEADVAEGAPKFGNQKIFSVVNFAKSVDISKNFFDDNQHGAWETIVRNFARRARTSRDKNAMSVYRNAFTTALTGDGVALISDSHLNLNGDTVDNKGSGALSDTTINTALVQLAELKSEDGEIDGGLASCLLVPLALYKTASIILDSELRSNTSNNDQNVYSDKYGITLYTSQFLGAAAGGSDTAWFLLSDTHSVTRYVRKPVETTLVDWAYQRNNNYVYKGEFREAVGAVSHEGIVGNAS